MTGSGRRVVGADGKVHIRVRRTRRRSADAVDARRSRSQQSVVADVVADAQSPTRLPSAQILHRETLPISEPPRPPTPPRAPTPPPPSDLPPPVVQAIPPPAVKQRAVRQVVNVDVGLAGAREFFFRPLD